jgi:hypothetical protein
MKRDLKVIFFFALLGYPVKELHDEPFLEGGGGEEE